MVDLPPVSGPVRVLHVVEMARGGISSYVNMLAAAQSRNGDDVFVAACKAHGVEWIDPAVGTVVPYTSGRSARAVWTAARHLERIVLDLKPDIIHAHSTFPGLYMRVLPRKAKARLVYQPHGWAFLQDVGFLRLALFGAVEKYLQKRADVIVNISHTEYREALRNGLEEHRMVVVRHGVPVAKAPEPLGLDRTATLRVGFVGRFDRQKGLDLVVEASRRVPEAAFYVVGEASRGDARLPPLPDTVTNLGWLGADRIDAFYRAVDVVVVPSRWEGFGLVAAEAMRNATPVIVSDVGALQELVIHGYNGYVMGTGDVGQLCQILRSITPHALAVMGDNAYRVYSTCLRSDRSVKDMAEVYRSLLHPGSSGVHPPDNTHGAKRLDYV